jgi:hypothetical protein
MRAARSEYDAPSVRAADASDIGPQHPARYGQNDREIASGEQPRLFGVEPPKPRLEAVRVVDMASSNAWAEFATIFTRSHQAHLQHEQAKAELKSLVPEEAKEAIGHGVRAKRSKTGAVSFDLVNPDPEPSNAAV